MRTGLYAHVAGVVCLGLSTAVMAGPIATDPAAMPGFSGTAVFNASNSLQIDLDYAVYAPNTYPNDGVAGTDPSGGTEYVYAYQAFNVSTSRVLSAIGITLNECSAAHHLFVDLVHPATDGLAPSDLVFFPDSVTAEFPGAGLPAGAHSAVFLFTSQNPPTWAQSAVLGGGLSAPSVVPTPQPSPPMPPDFDDDCDVDLSDYQHLQSCLTGPAIAQTLPDCENADLDADGDVDQSDFGLFQRCFGGTDGVPDQKCLET